MFKLTANITSKTDAHLRRLDSPCTHSEACVKGKLHCCFCGGVDAWTQLLKARTLTLQHHRFCNLLDQPRVPDVWQQLHGHHDFTTGDVINLCRDSAVGCQVLSLK